MIMLLIGQVDFVLGLSIKGLLMRSLYLSISLLFHYMLGHPEKLHVCLVQLRSILIPWWARSSVHKTLALTIALLRTQGEWIAHLDHNPLGDKTLSFFEFVLYLCLFCQSDSSVLRSTPILASLEFTMAFWYSSWKSQWKASLLSVTHVAGEIACLRHNKKYIYRDENKYYLLCALLCAINSINIQWHYICIA